MTKSWAGIIISLLLLLGTVSPLIAQTHIGDLLQLAQQAYQAGEYEQAIQQYEILRQTGLNHPALYYNLGNAYFKQGEFGWAIVNYRKAQLLTPRDPQIAENLQTARRLSAEQLPPSVQGPIEGLAVATSWFTRNELLQIGLFFWLGAMLLILPTIFLRTIRPMFQPLAGLCMIPVVFIALSIVSRIVLDVTTPAVVVTDGVVEATTGPGATERYDVAFRLRAGAEGRLLQERQGWYQISMADNLQGWIPAETAALVRIE